MTPLERLLQEAVPVRPVRPDASHSLWTEQEQDRHWDDLCRAVGAPNHRKHPPRKPPQADPSEAAA
ncbi:MULTISPECIES: hypothetical protein [unclassified Streptomyces]|uniref:hypothetical protein n=1 Tax=unclassified Streptomyces TaxID=2593676 RepID=UPI0036EEA43D